MNRAGKVNKLAESGAMRLNELWELDGLQVCELIAGGNTATTPKQLSKGKNRERVTKL